MPEGLVTVITTADMQAAYGNNPDSLEKYCIVRTFEGAEADSIMASTFSDYFAKYNKMRLNEDVTEEMLAVNDKIKRYLANDQGAILLEHPETDQIWVTKITCYQNEGNAQARPIISPRTRKPFAVTSEPIKDFLTTIDIDGKQYNHLDMVVDTYFIVGK